MLCMRCADTNAHAQAILKRENFFFIFFYFFELDLQYIRRIIKKLSKSQKKYSKVKRERERGRDALVLLITIS